jgi:hypothetical protein
MDKLELILEWATIRNMKGNKFDTTFLESVKDFYGDVGEITESQERAIDNIYEKFKIQAWDERRNS